MHALRIIIVTIAAASLIVNAVIHLTLAGSYDAITGTLIGQGDLFRIQAVVNIAVAALLLVSLRYRRWAGVVSFAAVAVAAGGLALVVITAVVPLNLSALGLPYLFEPIWFADKVVSALVQGIALIAAALSAALSFRRAGTVQP
ncbi:hypothetical protein [Microcella sp.]|uniref:hypothetical protein n=1 Tax=Microcella sp. TaxID=1913979 RepID=UPI0025679844|nr:hypothetical protein [Microcella sp.]MBX9472564.1 hypothetical protein [Microcella sp.]